MVADYPGSLPSGRRRRPAHPGDPVLSRIDLRGERRADPAPVLPRARLDVEAALEAVRPVCDAVRTGGADAVRGLTRRFDGVELTDLRVPAVALTEALERLDPAVRAALEEAVRRARVVHQAQRRPDAVVDVAPGATVTERWLPVRRVGLYVPGGLDRRSAGPTPSWTSHRGRR